MMERKFVKFWQTNITKNSSKSKIHKINEEIFVVDNEDEDLSDIDILEDDIIEEIGKMNMNSAAGPDGIPAIFLIKTKYSIAAPLKIILRKCLDEEKISDIFKLA